MAKQTVNIGTAANDGTGDPLRTAFDKVNDNFDEVYGNNFVTHAMLNDDIVDHDELADRYTTKVETSHATGAYSLDWATGTTWEFTASLTGGIELDFTNFKQGQVIDIYGLTGSQTITLDSDAATSETFNKVGGVDYDGSATNHLQVICVDDSDDAVFNYAIATYTSDTTPS
jgi:hypothetical protein